MVEFFGDGESGRIGLLVETQTVVQCPEKWRRLSHIVARPTSLYGKHAIEVSTNSSQVFRQFFYFASAVAERIMVDSLAPTDAIALEIECFLDLLAARAILGIERQIGLMGELCFLEHFLATRGPVAIDAWVGPVREPHDFRFANREFEIKTTTAPRRVHLINGLEQLVPSKDCDLFIGSVLLAPAGAASGFSLTEQAGRIRNALSESSAHLERFNSLLEASDLAQADEAEYTRRFVLRRPIAIIGVDNKVPQITRPLIQGVLGTLASRVKDVVYEAEFEGLESEYGSSVFAEAMAF